ncbi:AMED_5909 family protein [Amycolatopsis orientalis]|uniref:AMED_5909 family protein n=1 Tax=Amycolatopsis orientalis TaxID=31958 RepID=UPI0003A3BE47|nr:AMED_5909 family protein [Amycolatopsis orientalis]
MATKTGPRTLDEAHADKLSRLPRGPVSSAEKLLWHKENMRMYQEVAEIDTRHHYEALSCAFVESLRIAELEQSKNGAEAGKE